MSATLFNAPARPLLTRTLILLLSVALLAAAAVMIVSGRWGTSPGASTADRPAFIRRAAPER